MPIAQPLQLYLCRPLLLMTKHICQAFPEMLHNFTPNNTYSPDSATLPIHPQELDIPMELKSLYKTVWEIKQRVLVDMAADRGAFIDQSQSFNVHMSDPNFGKLTSLHFYSWRKGLKTGA